MDDQDDQQVHQRGGGQWPWRARARSKRAASLPQIDDHRQGGQSTVLATIARQGVVLCGMAGFLAPWTASTTTMLLVGRRLAARYGLQDVAP